MAFLATISIAALSAALFFLFFPKLGSWVVRTRVLPRLAERLGRDLAVARIDVRYGTATFSDITVTGPHDAPGAPLLSVNRVAIDFDFWRALRGDVRLGTLLVDDPRVALHRDAGGDNFSDVVDRLRRPAAGAPTTMTGGRVLPARAQVRGGSVVLVDEQGGLRAGIDAIDGEVALAPAGPIRLTLGGAHADHRLGPRVAAATILVDAELPDPRSTLAIEIHDGSASALGKLSLTGITGTVKAGDQGRAVVALRGGYGGVDEVLWRADGWLDPAGPAGAIQLRADRFTLDRIEKVLVDTPIQQPEATAIDAALDLTLKDGVLAFGGAVNLSGLTVFHPGLADEPVRDLGFRGTIRGRYALAPRVLTLDELAVTFRGLEARLDGEAALVGGLDPDGRPRERRRLRARLVVPPVPCQTALNALPRELTPRLVGFQLKGTFDTDLHVAVDWADLDALELGGSVGIWGCKVVSAPDDMTQARLQGEFEHVVELEQDDFMSFVVGPSNPDFVPIADVSPYLLNSLMTTEDSGFMKHHGFINREFRSALIKDLKEGYFKYGASSITMQIAKNVFLYRQKTLARKLQELFLTWYIETVLPKERLLEIYVNVIEFGPGIYGIGPAARHYFGKRAKDLTPIESAFFSSILPNPKGRYLQYCKGELSRWADAKIQRILKLERERGLLTDEELAQSLAAPLAFDRTEALPENECILLTKKMIEKARPTQPQGKRTL
jgi:hypothetical protein